MVLDFKLDGHVAVLTLNRPQAMNSFDPELHDAFRAAMARVDSDSTIRVAIITGAGDKAFSTGADLKKTMPPKESFAELFFGGSGSASRSPFNVLSEKPTIAAVNGYAYGGGLELALACDIRIAADTARFALPEVKVGSIPGAGGTQRLPRAIGSSDAMLMLLTGDAIPAEEALRIGLVSRVVPRDTLVDEAVAIARRIAANAPLSVRAVKSLVTQYREAPLAAAIQAERTAWGVLRDTEDRIEGRRAFAEKRPPVYRGR